MKKILKYTGVTCAWITGVVLGIIVPALVIINLINIGSYRSEIEKIAADSGVKLKLEGDISHSVMHRISLELDDVVIYESTQDGAPEFVRVKKLRVSISPFALLTGKTVHINRAVLTDTTVTNRIYADGSSTISRFTGGLPKSPPPPPNPNPIDIFAYNLQADELNIENIAFRNINLPRKQEFTASGVTLRASDVNLDRNSVLRLSFNTQITNNGKPELIFDAVLSTQFRLNRTERIFTAENFTFDGELTYKGFDRQKINLNIPAAEFNINALALKPTQAGFSIGDMLSGTLHAEGTFKNDTAVKFKLQTDIPDAKPLLQKVTGKAYKSRIPLPLLLGVEGGFAKQTLSFKSVTLGSGTTSVGIQPISFNVQDKTYSASLNITSRNLKQILDSVDMNLLRDNIRIDLKSDFKGDIEHGQHRATLNGSADELNLRLDASSKGTDNKNLALTLGMEVVSPDVVKLLKKVSADVGYPEKIPLETTLKTEVQLTDDQVNLNQFRFELNNNFLITASGKVNDYKTDMSYSLDMKSSFKDLKRLIALFTSGRVNFEPEALENITLAVGVSGSKKLLKVSRFALQNRDIDLNAETTVQFSPLNIQASVKSGHLRVDSFIPLPVKQNTAKDSLSVKTKKIPPEEDAAVKDVSGVADTSDAAVKSPPLYTLDKQGNIVLSRLPLAELLTIPDMSVRADIDMTGIRYRRHESMRFSSLIRVKPKTQIVAEIDAGYKKYADVSVKMDARRDDKAVKLNTDILADVSLSKEMGEDIPAEGKISLKTSLNSEGDTLIEFWDKLKLNTDINFIGIRYQGDPLPEPVMLDGRAQIKMADKIFTAQLSGLNIRNTKPDVDAEALRASVGNMKMSVSLDQILNREVDIRELVVQDTNIRLYQNRQGFLGMISSVPDANNASVDKGATKDKPAVKSVADKKPAQSGARSEPPLKKISLNVLKITNTRFAFADLSADTDISADTAEISVALPQVNLFADGLSADSFNFVLKQVRMGRQLKKQSDVAFSNDEVALNTSNLRLNYAPFKVWLGELKVDIRQVKADMVSSGQLLAVPSLGILLQGMNADMQRQAAYIKLFSLDLPQLNAETKTQTLSAENFNVKLDALAVEGFTDINKIRAKSEQFIIQNQTLTAKTKADGRRSIIRDAQIDIRIPESPEKIYPSVSFYAEDYDATADSPRYAVYGHIGGILGALPADNYYYTDLTVGGSVFAAGINEFAEPIAGRISTAFDGKKSHIIIPELSFVLGSLARLDSNADIVFAGGILNSAGKFVINSPDLRPLLKSQVGTPEHKIPLDVALDFNSRLRDNNRTHLTVKSSILTVGTAVSGLDLSANMSQNYTDIKGTLDVHTSGVRSLLNNLPVKPLNTADSRVIDRMMISSVFNYKNNTATLEKLSAEADDIRLNADGYHNLDTGKSVINISVANIDIDRYLPPVKEEQPEEKPAEIKERKPAEYPKTPLLTDELKRLITEQDVSVNISLRDLKVKNIRTEQIKLRTVAKEGIIRVMPLEIINGDGRLELTAFADVNREMYNTELTGKDFQLGDIINPLVKKDFFSGKFNSRIALKTSGNSVHNMVSGSNGVIDITMTEGQLRGFNIDYYTCVGLSAISFEIPDKEKFPADTAFTYTNIQGYVRNGNVKLYDVFSDLTTIQMAAKGEAELIAQTFKADSYVSIIEAKENYCEVQDAIKQYTLKISCDGKMYDPGIDTCAPDYNALGSLVYKGVAGKTDQLLRHYQKQVETVTSTVSAPLKVLRDFFVRFFRKIGGIFSGDNKPSPESSPPSEVINLYFRREDIISSALHPV